MSRNRSIPKRVTVASRTEAVPKNATPPVEAEQLRAALAQVASLESERVDLLANLASLNTAVTRLERRTRMSICSIGEHSIGVHFDADDADMTREWAVAVVAANHALTRMFSLALTGQGYDWESEDEQLLTRATHGLDFLSCIADQLTRSSSRKLAPSPRD